MNFSKLCVPATVISRAPIANSLDLKFAAVICLGVVVKKNVLTGCRGFGVIEVLVAGTIGMLLAYATTRMFDIQFRGQKRVETKVDMQTLQNRLHTILSSEDTCTANFAEILTNKEFNPAALSDFNNDPTKSTAGIRLGDATVLTSGSKSGTLLIGSLRLRIAGEILPMGGGRYDSAIELRADTSDSSGRALAGGELAPRNIPVLLITEPVSSSSPPLRRITRCVAKSGMTGPEACELIGGRWVSSLGRCYMGGELKLGQFEYIDPAEFAVGGPLEGAVIDECYFRYYSRTLSYRCFNTPVTAVPWCMFQRDMSPASNNGWVLKYPRWSSILRNCSGGVVIRVPDQKLGFLHPNEYAPGYFFGPPPEGAAPINGQTSSALGITEYSRNFAVLDSVLECQTRPEDANFRKCSQEERAFRGLASSCIFVNNARVYDLATSRWESGYTGWIWTTQNRTTSVRPSVYAVNRYTTTVEAKGYKCTTVKYLTDSADAPLLHFNYNSIADPEDPMTISNLLVNDQRAKSVSECLFVGLEGTDTTAATPTPANVDPTNGVGAYLHRYSCDNSKLELDYLVGDGAAYGENPSLTNGTCWYVKGIQLSANYKRDSRVNNTTNVYTGWVRMLENFPDNKYKVEPSGQPDENAMIPKVGVVRKLLAVPCNAGVRIPGSAPAPAP